MVDHVQIPDPIRNKLESGDRIDLELGCGNRKRHFHAIGIDRLPYEGVDIVGDIESVIEQFPIGRVDHVYAYHCFEHLPNLERIMDRLARIMKLSGKLFVEVPHFSNPYYYSDSTHRQPFGLYTFSYITREALFQRRCPTYQRRIDFELKNVKLVFKSPPPFYGRYGMKKIVQSIVNLSRYMQEFYEENVCWMVPCYEIHYELERC